MPTPYIDIHTHDGTDEENVTKVVCLSHDDEAVAEGLFCTAVHPWALDDEAMDIDRAMAAVKRKAAADNMAAVGETGIDRTHKDTVERQTEAFRRHIALAEELRKPLIIHSVRATSDILALHKALKPTQAWVMHGFNGNEQEIRQLTDASICISAGEAIMHDERHITKALHCIPTDRLFLETDTWDGSIRTIYERAAELLKTDEEALREIIFANFARITNNRYTR
ncbi:MAG: TatD family hydrolase [Paludibacteraceae bacterium]|nr:TatD family hydrolase [Paludibacteraceae bacterium]